MIKSGSIQINPKDEKETKNSLNEKTNIKQHLNPIEEDEKYPNNEEQQGQSSEDENLGYNSNYIIQKNNKYNLNNLNLEKKASNISTANSINEINLEQINGFYQNNLKMENNERKTSFNQYNQYTNINYVRERLNSTPITNYFQGIDFYLRGIQPEKNDYTKSGNFIEKEKFFKEKDFSFKNMKYKSFDLSEQRKFISNQALKRIDENNTNCYDNMMNIPQDKSTQINIENKIQNSTINNINIINNQPMIMQIPQNYENGSGKFDMPIYYVRYCDLDCKFIFFNY